MVTLLKRSITLALLALCKIAAAQNADTIIARAYYAYTHLLDTNKKGVLYKEDMLLALGASASVYTSLSKIYQDKSLSQQAEEQTKRYTGNGFPVIQYTEGRYTTSTDIYLFNNDKKAFIKENLIRDYLYEDTFPDINWQVLPDTASFKGVKCQKAACTFKGRKWIAWFSSELPFRSGPWQLTGLPGLILEASDEKNEVAFHFVGFEKAVKSGADKPVDEFKLVDYTQVRTISLPKERITANNRIKIVRTTKKEVDKLKAAMAADIKVFRRAQLQASNGVVYDEEAFQSLNWKPVINNPIDIGNK